MSVKGPWQVWPSLASPDRTGLARYVPDLSEPRRDTARDLPPIERIENLPRRPPVIECHRRRPCRGRKEQYALWRSKKRASSSQFGKRSSRDFEERACERVYDSGSAVRGFEPEVLNCQLNGLPALRSRSLVLAKPAGEDVLKNLVDFDHVGLFRFHSWYFTQQTVEFE